MAKIRSRYVCQECGFAGPKWMGKCPECEAWNSFLEEKEEASIRPKTSRDSGILTEPIRLADVEESAHPRITLPMEELNRLLGGGLTRGSTVLLAGDPGIGKSTLLIQLLAQLQASESRSPLYVSGEESARQIKLRAERLGLPGDDLLVFPETNLSRVFETIRRSKPSVLVLDSIQTVYWPELESIPGSVSQVKEIADRLVRFAKQEDVTVVLVGHVTKEGSIAGPKTLEHLVDTVLYFEGDRGHPFRILRAVKNRFGPTDEIGVFDMRHDGLHEVANPSELFLKNRPKNTPGTVVFPAMEGSRPLLIEIQGLATQASYGTPIRACVGFNKNRLTMLLAVLEKRLGLAFGDQDVHVNVVGGLTVNEPAADLAVVVAILASYLSKPFPEDAVAFGEVGLAGEIREVTQTRLRLREAKKLGFAKAVQPSSQESAVGLEALMPKGLNEVLDFLR